MTQSLFLLALSHMRVHHLQPRQFFRAAYMWKWTKDLPDLSLTNDLKLFHENHQVPVYVRDYLNHIYD